MAFEKYDAQHDPIYVIGDLSAKAQIRISLIDNNKDDPRTSGTWKDFFVNSDISASADIVRDEFAKVFSGLLVSHLSNYHMAPPAGSPPDETQLRQKYLDAGMENMDASAF